MQETAKKIFVSSLNLLYEIHYLIILISQMRKLRLRKISTSQPHKSQQWQSWGTNSGVTCQWTNSVISHCLHVFLVLYYICMLRQYLFCSFSHLKVKNRPKEALVLILTRFLKLDLFDVLVILLPVKHCQFTLCSSVCGCIVYCTISTMLKITWIIISILYLIILFIQPDSIVLSKYFLIQPQF